MKQLELDFKDENTTENYHSVTIDKGGNQIFKWYDTLSECREKITYHEYVYDTPNYLDLENWIDINKKGMGKYAFWWFKMYLKSMTRQKDRLEILLDATRGKGKDLAFLKRWNYDNEQIIAISIF